MKSFKIRILLRRYEPIPTWANILVSVGTFQTNDCPQQDGVIVAVDDLTCTGRLMTCALRDPKDEFNFFEGLRNAVARLPIGFDLRKQIFFALIREWVAYLDCNPPPEDRGIIYLLQMLEEVEKVQIEGAI